MLDIRKKREAFHQSIRQSRREALRKVKRHNFAVQQQHQELLNAIHQAFSFCEDWQEEKRDFWDIGPSNRRDYYSGPFHFLEQTSQSLKDLLLQFDTNVYAKLDISYYLIENLPFLVPPSHHYRLDELPKSFIQLCMFILRNPQHDNCDKENFIHAIPHETIARCLLKYFADNWAEIIANKCSDIVMSFFFQFNKHKNTFSQSMYNDRNFQFLLEESIKYIMDLAEEEIKLYNSWNSSKDQFRNQDYDDLKEQNLLNLAQKEFSQQEKIVQLIKYTTFLSNILLLSPIPNFNIKQVRNELKTIAFYLYRKILLNEYDPKFHISAEFCVSILLSYSSQVHLAKQIQVMTKILNNQIQRIQSERYQKSEKNQEIEIDQIVPTKEENLEGEDIIEKDESTYDLLSRMSLLMISNMAQNSTDLRYKHVQKWFYYQIRLKEKSIFKIQNPDIIKCFLQLMRKLIWNEQKCPETYKSYSYDRVLSNERHEQVFRIKTSICRLIERKGFDQLLKNQGIRQYHKEFCDLLCSLMDGMDEIGDVSAIVLSLFKFGVTYNQQNLEGIYQWDNREDEVEETQENYDDDRQSNILSAIRVFIFKLSMQFLERTYKYLPSKQKEELMLHLVNSDNLSEEEMGKYLTVEEKLTFKKHIYFKWQSYNSDEDEFIDDQVHQKTQYGVDNQKEEAETQNGTIWTYEDKRRFENSQQTQK